MSFLSKKFIVGRNNLIVDRKMSQSSGDNVPLLETITFSLSLLQFCNIFQLNYLLQKDRNITFYSNKYTFSQKKYKRMFSECAFLS